MTNDADFMTDREADEALAAALASPDWSLEGLKRRRTGVKWSLYGPEVLPAWVADMDLPIAPALRETLAARIGREDLGYRGKVAGEAGAAFAEHMSARHGWEVDPGAVRPIVDVVQGLYAAVLAFTEPGDGVVVQTPIYPPFLTAVADTERRLEAVPLESGEQRFEIDFDAFESAASRSRLLLLCNPHNPGSRAFERAELERIADIAERHDLVVVADEIHSDLVFDGREHLPFAGLGPQAQARTLTFNACTKAYNVAGLRYALAHFGSPSVAEGFAKVPERLFGGTNVFGEEITALAWRSCGAWQRAVLRYLQGNRDWLVDVIEGELPGVRLYTPEATYLAWLDCRALQLNSSPHAFFLEQAKVGMNDGEAFGPPGTGHVRLNFATPRPVLEAIIGRMVESLR